MSLWIGLPLVLISALLRGSLLTELRVQGGRPDLVLMIALSWSILGRDAEGLVWAFVGGLFLDLLSGAPLGVSSFGLVLAAFVAGVGRRTVRRRQNILLPIVMTVIGTAIYHLTTLVLLVLLRLQPPTWVPSLVYVTLPSGGLNLAFIVPIFLSLGMLYARLHPQRGIS